MNLMSLMLFTHIVGALLLFLGIGLMWVIALRLRTAQTLAQVRDWAGLAKAVGRIGPISAVLVVGAGIYMMAEAWGAAPWIIVALGAMLLLMMPGMLIAGRKVGAIRREAEAYANESRIPAEMRGKINDPVLWVAIQVWAAAALGVVFLMTTKPDMVGSLVTIAVALVVGLVGGALTTAPRGAARVAAPAR